MLSTVVTFYAAAVGTITLLGVGVLGAGIVALRRGHFAYRVEDEQEDSEHETSPLVDAVTKVAPQEQFDSSRAQRFKSAPHAEKSPIHIVALRTAESSAGTVTSGVAALSDEELLALIVRRESAALGELYDRYGRLAFTVAMRITRDRRMAERVTQGTFLSAWRSAISFQKDDVSYWLMGTTASFAIDAVRLQRRHAHVDEGNFLLDLPLNELMETERQIDKQFDIWQILSRLRSELLRKAIELSI